MTSSGSDASLRGTEDPSHELDGAIDRLVNEFGGVFSRESVAQCVRDSASRLGAARVQTYQSLLAYRFARERLRATAQVRGELAHPVPVVLLVCLHNAGRSQMAAALLEHAAQGRVEVRSAGTEPAPQVQPAVLDALTDAGVPHDGAYPKPLTDEVVQSADVVVTMGCGDACPVLPGRRYLDWDLPDPAGASPQRVAEIRDEIAVRVDRLLQELLGGSAP